MSIRVSLCSMLRLILVDTLRRVYTVGFLARRLICCMWESVKDYLVINRNKIRQTSLDIHTNK